MQKILDLIVIIPVFNEQEIIEAVLMDWIHALSQLKISYEIHVYNDGSIDNTKEILNKVSKDFSVVKAHHNLNVGHGPTILKGYIENIKKCKWLFQVDSDNEMSAVHFTTLWEKINYYDFIVAKRVNRSSPMPRKLISFISRLSVNIFYTRSIWDVNSPYRLMRCCFFQHLVNKIPAKTFEPNLIISGYAGTHKARILELKVPNLQRKTGEVSIKKWNLFKAALKSFIQNFVFRIFILK